MRSMVEGPARTLPFLALLSGGCETGVKRRSLVIPDAAQR